MQGTVYWCIYTNKGVPLRNKIVLFDFFSTAYKSNGKTTTFKFEVLVSANKKDDVKHYKCPMTGQ